MNIRKFKKEDAKKTWKVMRKAMKLMIKKSGNIYSFWESYYYSPTVLNFISGLREIYVAEENGKILGTAGLDNGYLLGVYVHPKTSGKGIGTKLVKKIEQVAKRKKYKEVKTLAASGAIKFYQKLGYKIDLKIGHLTFMKKKI